MTNKDERLMATLIYVSSFFTTFIGPLIIWLLKKDESSYVDYHGREYFNFLISYTIYGIVSGILVIVLIGAIALFVIGILAFIFTIIAAVKAYEGERYQIPLVIRFIK
ncbi:DUF4870 domain-containing protein [Bacillus sp. FJAT-49736]|uniref:DUF4870 domain-containing protein n=1 Tax=Bacillus sp. FJAT-49736 TaxID=2833582 RepID=UPI001BC95378|nr:DUF4870 domain-containing protein [Bacillus sp. FJAT-49736]MBS4173174.1 DUF4870 domain-containing protein [Bacillus sp. FJAT-49736]